MKKIILTHLLLVSYFISFGQGKQVIITKRPKEVPAGKVWKLERSKETKVQVSEGTLKSGSLCNAMFLSRPGIVFNINKGDYYSPESFKVIFQSFEKVPYTNDYTYSLVPTSIVDKNFELSELTQKKPEEVGTKEIEFIAGETVFVGTCLESIELTEYDMSKEQLEAEKKKKEAIEAKKNKLKANFNIPVNPEKYVEPSTKPDLHDSNLNKIVFSSSGVMHKRPGKGFAFDDVSVWTMTLTIEGFEIKSSNGIYKSYSILNIEYDEALTAQKFELGDNSGKHTHNLHISWSNSSEQYYVILASADNSEEYQFQQTQATKKE